MRGTAGDPGHGPTPLASGATMSARARVLLAACGLGGLYLSSLVSYLLLHTLAEAFFALVAAAVLVVAWNLREFLDDDYPLFMGMALVAVAALRVAHTIEYQGADIVGAGDPGQAAELWVAAGYLSGVSLMLAPAFIGRRLSAGLTAGALAATVLLVLGAVYAWDVFPAAWGADGVTRFTQVSEYVIAAAIAGGLALMLRQRDRLGRETAALMSAALALWVVAELTYGAWVGGQDTPNLVAHLLSVLSVYLVYTAVVEAGLARPHALAVVALRDREQEARRARDRAEAVRSALDELLRLTPGFHGDDDVAAVTGRVCEAARRLFGAAWAALLVAEDGELVVLGREPEAALMPRGARFPVAADPGLGGLLATRSPAFVADGSIGHLVPGGVERRTRARGEPLLCAPVGAWREGGAGMVLALSWPGPRAEPEPMLVALVQRFADQAAVALEQARRREAQERATRLHQRLEASLVPSLPVTLPGLRIATRYRPGERRLLLGGDFIGMGELDDGRLALVVGDVSGHGPDAAALGATLRAAWQALTFSGAGVHKTVETLARVLRHESASQDVFVTLCAAWIDPSRSELSLLDMGHPLPLLVAETVGEAAARTYPPLGVLDGLRWRPSLVRLPSRWTLVFYTDGLIEGRAAPDAEARFGVERLAALAAREFGSPGERLDLDAALDRIVADAAAANGGPLPDDVAIVAVTGAAARPPDAGSGVPADATARRGLKEP